MTDREWFEQQRREVYKAIRKDRTARERKRDELMGKRVPIFDECAFAALCANLDEALKDGVEVRDHLIAERDRAAREFTEGFAPFARPR